MHYSLPETPEALIAQLPDVSNKSEQKLVPLHFINKLSYKKIIKKQLLNIVQSDIIILTIVNVYCKLGDIGNNNLQVFRGKT